jgi:chromatin segregation and condensation protein Rec8/ScpA/Scc1 (kleisin family)
VAIEDIAMAPIVARYLEYVREAARQNVSLDVDWLYWAATLIDWKSRALLPHAPSPDLPADPVRDDLVRQLRAHCQQAAGRLAERQAVESQMFSPRRAEDPGDLSPAPAESRPGVSLSVWDLIQQARELARWVEQHRQDRRRRESFGVEQDDVTVEEMVDYLRAQLASQPGDLDAVALLHSQPTAARRSCLFLGMLEMARRQEIGIEQEEAFGAMRLSPLQRP